MTKAKLLKITRQIHGWIGILVFPLIFLAGFTGFYLNHSNSIFGFLKSVEYDESQFEDWPDAQVAEISTAVDLTAKIWPGVEIERITSEPYHGRPSYQVETSQGLLIVSKPTSHYFVKTSFRRQTFSPSGELLHNKIYWGSLFKWLHVRGWPSDRLGTFLTDISSIALVMFSLSGVILWWLPKAKKIKRTLVGALMHGSSTKC